VIASPSPLTAPLTPEETAAAAAQTGVIAYAWTIADDSLRWSAGAADG